MEYIIGTLLFGLILWVFANIYLMFAKIHIPIEANLIIAIFCLIFGYFLTRYIYDNS
jgi:hypothetical protein